MTELYFSSSHLIVTLIGYAETDGGAETSNFYGEITQLVNSRQHSSVDVMPVTVKL